MSAKTISEMTSEEVFEAVDSGMAEVSRLIESGEIDGSGRYYTDEELAAGAALNRKPSPPKQSESTLA
jgi:hypothetical protein